MYLDKYDMEINEALVKRVLEVVDAGLCSGMGEPIPGQMCIEAAVCYALGLPHSDNPPCVSQAVRRLKISLNDLPWSSPTARAVGLRRLGIAQLGTRDNFNDIEFAIRVSLINYNEPSYVKWANAWLSGEDRSQGAAYAAKSAAESAAYDAWSAAWGAAWNAAESAAYDAWSAAWGAAWNAAYAAWSATEDAAWSAAWSAAWNAAECAANGADKDKSLGDFAEAVVQILIKMNTPGSKFLYLTEKVLK